MRSACAILRGELVDAGIPATPRMAVSPCVLHSAPCAPPQRVLSRSRIIAGTKHAPCATARPHYGARHSAGAHLLPTPLTHLRPPLPLSIVFGASMCMPTSRSGMSGRRRPRLSAPGEGGGRSISESDGEVVEGGKSHTSAASLKAAMFSGARQVSHLVCRFTLCVPFAYSSRSARCVFHICGV